MISVGLVGFGFSGATFHAPLIFATPGLSLDFVVSSKPDLVRAAYPAVKVLPTTESLLLEDQVQLVVIASAPNELHAVHTRQAVEAGKSVVVEKPFVVNSEEGYALTRLAAEKGVSLGVFHNRRWDADFITIQKVQASLGIITHFEAHFDRFRPLVRDRWRERDPVGGGALFDLGSHIIDQALTLLGPPLSVSADLACQRSGSTVDDYFHVVLHYPDGKRGILHGSSMCPSNGRRYTIHGTLGSFLKDGLDVQEEQLKAGRRPGDVGWGREEDRAFGDLVRVVDPAKNECAAAEKIPSENGAYENFYEKMREAIGGRGEVPVGGKEASDVIKVIELAIKSDENQGIRISWS